MTQPVLKAAAVSGVTRLLAGRPAAAATARRPAAEAAPYLPQSALAGAARAPEQTAPAARPDLEEMRREMETLRDAARQKGHDAGLAEGREKGEKAARAQAEQHQAEQAQKLAALFERLEKRLAGHIEQLEVVTVEVVLTACRKILGEAAITPQGVAGAVKAALAAAQHDEVLRVRLSPPDLALLRTALGSALPAGLPLEADDSLASGGCVVQIAGGSLDARLDSQFKLLAAALAQAARAHEDGPTPP